MAIKLTESRLRQIVREELTRVEEVAPGVRAPLEPDMTAQELAKLMQSVEYEINEYIAKMYQGEPAEIIEDITSDPAARENAFYSTTQASLAQFDGKRIGGLEEITDGSATATIIGFEYNPALASSTGTGIEAIISTDHGEIEVTLGDLRSL